MSSQTAGPCRGGWWGLQKEKTKAVFAWTPLALSRRIKCSTPHLVLRPMSFAMFEPSRITDRFVAHPRHSRSCGGGSLRALGARTRFSACTQTYGSRY